MGFFSKLFGKKESVHQESEHLDQAAPASAKPEIKFYNFHIVGSDHYVDNIKLVLDENILYESTKDELTVDEMVFEYDLEDRNDVQIVPEPDNEYDKNAVRVDIAGKTVGYIKKGACTRVKNLLKSPDFVKYEVDYIHYGKYKELRYNYDRDNFVVDRGRFDSPRIGITIYVRVSDDR